MPDNNQDDPLARAAKQPDKSVAECSRDGLFGTLPSAVGDTSLSGSSAPRASGLEKPVPGAPTEFGRYRILRELGAGAMGTVYLAEDTQLRRQVALKIPQLGNQPEPSRLDRFFREARLAATLSHPNICPIFDIGNHEGTHFISMAFVQGRPLSAHLKTGRPVAERTAASLVRKLALALHEAHKHGVIHRDLKPANIMIDQRGEPIVMDFGLARQANGNDEAQITQSGAILGTPAYMSPEQVRGETASVGAAADQYALGVILYQMLTGRLPFEGPVVSVLMQIATQKPATPSSHRTGIHPDLESICLRSMAREALERFADTGELANALAQFLKRSSTSAIAIRAADPIAAGGSPPEPNPGKCEPAMPASQASIASALLPSTGEEIPTAPSRLRQSLLTTKGIAIAVTITVAVLLVVLGVVLLEDNKPTTIEIAANGFNGGTSTIPGVGSGQALPAQIADEAGTESNDTAESESPDSETAASENQTEPGGWEGLATPPEGLDPGQGASAETEEMTPESDPAAEEQPTGDEVNPEEPDAAPRKGRPARRVPPDPFPVGSRWTGKFRQWFAGQKTPVDATLNVTVIARDKGTFRIRSTDDKGAYAAEVDGVIRGNRVDWDTGKSKVERGTIGRLRVKGQITNGDRLEVIFTGQSVVGDATKGTGTMHRQP
jgi:serine/threonine protein kinase